MENSLELIINRKKKIKKKRVSEKQRRVATCWKQLELLRRGPLKRPEEEISERSRTKSLMATPGRGKWVVV
jgi:hypothetical protein